jgi:hypothetical protein
MAWASREFMRMTIITKAEIISGAAFQYIKQSPTVGKQGYQLQITLYNPKVLFDSHPIPKKKQANIQAVVRKADVGREYVRNSWLFNELHTKVLSRLPAVTIIRAYGKTKRTHQ